MEPPSPGAEVNRTRLTVIGSGDAFNALGRAHSCYLLEGARFGPIMIDFGATALSALRRAGREPTEIAGLAFTHLHGDHIGGFPFLVIDGMFHAIRTAELPVVGPTRTRARLDELCAVAYGDVMDRDKPFEMRFTELAPGNGCNLAGARVVGFPADHMDPPEQPLCLRFELPSGEIVAFSGDTMLSEGLFSAADGADLLVAECSALAPPCGRHSSWQEWRSAFSRLTARSLLLSHLGTEVRRAADRLLGEAPPSLDLRFADDGMQVMLEPVA